MSQLGMLCILFLLLTIMFAMPASAQDDDVCPALVDAALAAVGDACGGLGRDEACYGNMRVEAGFWEPRDDLVFAAPADIVPLVDLKRVVTAPLDLDAELWGVAVLKLQANLPEAALAPGQAVTFLLMGDASLENEVPPEAAARAPRYGPMQAFYFSAGLGMPVCAEAPNALVVQGPQDVEVTFNINGMEVTLGSTVIFTMAEFTPAAGADPMRVLVGELVEGSLTAGFDTTTVQLTTPGASFAVTLNLEGRVDPDSQLVDLGGVRNAGAREAVEESVHYACLDADHAEVMARSVVEHCVAPVTYLTCEVPIDGSGHHSINVFACRDDGGRTVAAGCSYLIRMSIGFETPNGEAEARADQPNIELPVTMDGDPLPPIPGTVVEYNNFVDFWEINQFYSTGVLTPGTYTITGTSLRRGRYVDSATCILTVE